MRLDPWGSHFRSVGYGPAPTPRSGRCRAISVDVGRPHHRKPFPSGDDAAALYTGRVGQYAPRWMFQCATGARGGHLKKGGVPRPGAGLPGQGTTTRVRQAWTDGIQHPLALGGLFDVTPGAMRIERVLRSDD